MEGYLLKKGHILHTWKKRWMVLTEDCLEYYTDENKVTMKGMIVFDTMTAVESLREENSFRFLVQTASSVLEMEAANEIERLKWIRCVKEIIYKRHVALFYRDCLSVNLHADPVEVLNSILADDFISYGAQNKSKEELADQVQFFWKLIPDLKWEIQEMLVEANTVIVRCLATGSPRGDFMGLSGLDGSKSFRVTTIDMHTLKGGRIKHVHHLEDWGTAIAQLKGNGYVACIGDDVNVGVYRRVELTAEARFSSRPHTV
jgi:predicted ester cyclase